MTSATIELIVVTCLIAACQNAMNFAIDSFTQKTLSIFNCQFSKRFSKTFLPSRQVACAAYERTSDNFLADALEIVAAKAGRTHKVRLDGKIGKANFIPQKPDPKGGGETPRNSVR